MNIYLERLLNEELLFGLVIRFLGVFAVLFILMMIMYATGRLFRWYDDRGKKAAAPVPPPEGEDGDSLPVGPVPIPVHPGSHETAPPPGEVVAAVALAIEHAGASLPASGLPVTGEVAAAIAMALPAGPRALRERAGRPELSGDAASVLLQTGRVPDHSPWKILGRQDAFLGGEPWGARRRADRNPTDREGRT